MNELYQYVKELIELLKLKPRIKKILKVLLLVFFILFIAILFIWNKFIKTESTETPINIIESNGTIVSKGDNNKIVLDNSKNFNISQMINIKEIIDEYLHDPDIYYNYHKITKDGYNPYYLLCYYNHDSIFFESFKISNNRIRIINSVKSRDVEFIVSSAEFESKLDSQYLTYFGCMPHNCGFEYGMYIYSIKYDEGYIFRTDDIKGFELKYFTDRISTLYDIENILLKDLPELLDEIGGKGIFFNHLPSRRLPNLVDSLKPPIDFLSKIKGELVGTLQNPQILSELKIYGLYREDFFGNGLGWLTVAAYSRNSVDPALLCFFNEYNDLTFSINCSYLFGDAGDIYLIKEKNNNLMRSKYLVVVKDCGGSSGIQDVWMYRISNNQLYKIDDHEFIEKMLLKFPIENYSIN